ncbi:MAG: hypothetical protein EXS35_12230 [Pedosphaera sp.]|nr:hypothetical protein [Pedosphaera sp.]
MTLLRKFFPPGGIAVLLLLPVGAASALDLSKATIVIRPGKLPPAEDMAALVLAEEIKTRTGLNWPITTNWPARGAVIAITSGSVKPAWPKSLAPRSGSDLPENRPEGFRLAAQAADKQNAVVWIQGADSRGALFGVGQLLRSLEWGKHSAKLPDDLDIATAPARPIRGHQLGYRHTANSYDGWDDKQFDQYIRELALFGANSVEGIPFQDERKSPVMPLPREVMNRRLSEICARYELDYWIWVPADFDLTTAAKRTEHLQRHAALFRDCPRLDGVFFPGGDPGDNSPQLVFVYLEDLSRVLAKQHPRAKIWLSMQGFEKPEVDFVYQWINEHKSTWLGGLTAGPSSPPIPETRARLPKQYGLRNYPDITHTVRCQYPVAWWDPNFALTLGREPVNPRPAFYKNVLDHFGAYTSGFISYSDGVHDDVNKTIWSALGWQPEAQPREILLEYTRCFFGTRVAEAAADGILALEKNWEGGLAENGGVEATLGLWQRLEAMSPELRGNWRWQLCLLRAYYDAYIRQRLIYETALERDANLVLAGAGERGADGAMDAALGVLQRAGSQPVKPAWRKRIEELCAELFHSIKLQTSVAKYQASGAERGAVLDFVDHSLNNRWWLEDEFTRLRKMPAESDRLKQLELIRTWENPGPGSFYDVVGDIAKSPHVIRGEGANTDPMAERNPNPGYWMWEGGLSRRRLSWHATMDWPLGLVYDRLDPVASYRVRLTGYGHMRLRLNGQLATPNVPRIEIGEFMEFAVPAGLIENGKLKLTFDFLPEEIHLNWRHQSRVSEVWLLKN